MDGSDNDVARRTVLMSAGHWYWRGPGLRPVAGAGGVTPAAAAGEIWSAEYWAQKGNVKLNLWRKRVGAPKAGEKPLPVLFLVHGSSFSTRTSYDLQVPGNVDYSTMNLFARAGYDVWTMDHDGYGYSEFIRQQFRHRQRRRRPQGRDSGGGEGDRPAEDAFLRPVVGLDPRRRLRDGRAGAGRPAGAGCLHLQGQGLRRDGPAAQADRGTARQPAQQARRRHDPLGLHPRRPRRGLRSRADRGDRRDRDEARRHDPERHLSRHGGQPAAGRSDQGASRRC